MFNNRERKEERLNATGELIPDAKYNATIGGLTLYGLIMNAVLAYTVTPFMEKVNPLGFLIVYFICCLAGSFMAVKSSSPIVSFIGYNLVAVPIGCLLSLVLPYEDIGVVLSAFLVTAAVTGVMTVLALMKPDIFEGLGSTLFIALLIGVIGEFVATLFGYAGDLFHWLFVLIFSAYIGYDWHKAQMYPKTLDNAIDSALDLYLDIINLFIRLLEIFGGSKKK